MKQLEKKTWQVWKILNHGKNFKPQALPLHKQTRHHCLPLLSPLIKTLKIKILQELSHCFQIQYKLLGKIKRLRLQPQELPTVSVFSYCNTLYKLQIKAEQIYLNALTVARTILRQVTQKLLQCSMNSAWWQFTSVWAQHTSSPRRWKFTTIKIDIIGVLLHVNCEHTSLYHTFESSS